MKAKMNESGRKKRDAFRDRRVTAGESDPYEELAAFGVSYESSMAEVHHGGMAAQRRKELTSARREAWGELRNAEKRLLVDFFYYQGDPSLFSSDTEDAECAPIPAAELWPLLAACWLEDSEEPTPLPSPSSFLKEES